MDFPKLYRDNHQWSIKVINYPDVNQAVIETTHGTIGGKQQTHQTTISKGKAKRTYLDQATAEAKSKWTAKRDKHGYTTSKTGEKDSKTVKQNCDDLLAKNRGQIVQPMLANKYTPNKTKLKFPLAVQRKYDGIRCLSFMSKDMESTHLITRQRKPIYNFHTIRKVLLHIFKHLKGRWYIDGELYSDTLPFEELSGLVRLEAGKIPKEKEEQIRYHVYDIFCLDDLSIPFNKRWDIITKQDYRDKKNVCHVQTLVVKNVEELNKKFHDFIEEGYEGLMLRKIDSPYVIRKRSNNLLKYKSDMEEEFKITGFHEGTGDAKGTPIWELETKDGKTFSATPKGTREFKKELFRNAKNYIGKHLTVKFQEYTKDGIPRFPIGKAIREGY